jgi:hypothetical protein
VSQQEKQHLYVGGAKEIVRDGREPYLRIDLDLTELKAKMEEGHIRKWTSRQNGEHRCIALIVAPMKPENRTEYKTHSVKIDTWVPDAAKKRQQPKPDDRPDRRDIEAENSGAVSEETPF